jgi:cytochrome c biogenesis protein
MLYRFFTSVRLTIALLLGLSLISIIGTVQSVENNRFEVFFQTPWFRILLVLLSVNIAVCTWKTLRRNLNDRERFSALIKGQPDSKRVHCSGSADVLESELKSAGFKLRSVDGGVIASRGRLGRWGSTVVHISLLIILLGGILSEFGFVGTLMLPVGDKSSTYFSWDYEVDLPLGFTVQLDDFQIVYYPIAVRFGVYDPQTKEELASITTREGESVHLPIDGLTAKVVKFVPFDRTLHLDILHNGKKVDSYRTPSDKSEEPFENLLDSKLLIRLTGFKDPVDKQYRSKVSILEQGKVVKTGAIEVNHPLVHRGVAIYQTAYNQDEFGFWYSGFQLSKDPGEPLVWTGSILLIIGLCCAFSIRYRVLAVVSDAAGVSLQPLTGFGDERGQRLLEQWSLQGDSQKQSGQAGE